MTDQSLEAEAVFQMPPRCALSALTPALSVSVPPVRPPPPMMRPAFVPHILQRPGNF